MSDTAIAYHALLSDRHSSALVDRSGSVEWLSFPRFLCERRRSRRVPRAIARAAPNFGSPQKGAALTGSPVHPN
jgi:GH15 family glucan-1,4-alpha-glucosidase